MSAVVDADGHGLEPPDCWARYVDPPWRERAIPRRPGADGPDVLEIDGRPVPVAHLTLGDPVEAARELRRAVRAGARGGFLLPFTMSGVPHGHPTHDPLWAAAEELDVPIALHTGVDPTRRSLHQRFDGLSWPDGVLHGIRSEERRVGK